MRALVQRVTQASVTVGDETVGSIGRGICVLLGIAKEDTAKEIKYMVKKILHLRVFEDDSGKRWMKNVMDQQLEVLCISQFTLTCTMKGHKPDFRSSMGADQSESLYAEFMSQLKKSYMPERIKDGRFGAYMQVHIQNDGPVTIQLDSPSQAKTLTASAGDSKNNDVGDGENLADKDTGISCNSDGVVVPNSSAHTVSKDLNIS